MRNIELKLLNEFEANTLQYLPYGVTTIEMTMKWDENLVNGFIYPKKWTLGKNRSYFGYADDNEDIIVIWGGGKHKGVYVDEKNAKGKLFLQLLDRSENPPRIHRLSLRHSKQKQIKPILKMVLVPAKTEDIARMRLNQKGKQCTITFTGNTMPQYYSRWFPPRKAPIQYHTVKAPRISIEFEAQKNALTQNINSDIDVFLNDKKIAEVKGDRHYSWPHAELFTLFGNSDYVVLRFWLYWLHGNYSTKIVLGGDALRDELGRPKDEETRRGWWEAANIEYPDIERFDFLIDVNKKEIVWVGTDFHYQEFWYKPKANEFVEARIANDIGTIVEVLKKLKKRFNPPKDYNPMEELKRKILGEEEAEELDLELDSEPMEYLMSRFEDDGKVTYRREGMFRKHVPRIKNATYDSKLVSSVVTS